MERLADDDELVAFWQRHTVTGVALCVILPAIAALHTWLSPEAAPGRRGAIYGLAAAVALMAPLLLRVPVDRLARHPRGRWFFDVWEALGVVLVTVFSLLDGGAHSLYATFFYVLLAHAALAYPPIGMAIAGAGNIAGYLVVGIVAGDATAARLLGGALGLAVAAGVCAYASYNHALVYRRTKAFARQLAVLAERDGLTGCLNHRTFQERLQAEALIADAAHPLSLLIIDVDRFKDVNDTFGHPAGDEVLRRIGQVLQELSRADDAAGRLGGDEFALLLPGTGPAQAIVVADRLREQVRSRADDVGATVSIGVATSTERAGTAGLLARADRAVYVAKRAGRDLTVGQERTSGRSLRV